VKELEHPESREKRSNLVTDRPGQSGGVGGRGAFVSQTDPSKHEAEIFALRLAKELDHGRVTNSYDRLILVVSSPFLGLLNNRLSNHVQALVSDTIEKDYTKENDKVLAKHLEHCIYL
jgi:protein required for attachment to host cells